ncbi:WD40/YVTN/BNR-like repeat-containing protein [Micromonospora sp. 067-2]|uniref:WD40/YVTN/BNR-like repeat-containing protein n=1 Tax=Micromonospora sp. 067-2 TaxID=2789270 RepID=UPI0039781FD7
MPVRTPLLRAVILTTAVLLVGGCRPVPAGPPAAGPPPQTTAVSATLLGTGSSGSAASTPPGTPHSTGTRTAPPTRAAYSFRPLRMGGTGFVTGLVAHPTSPGVVFAREDVGGLVRWNEATQGWTPLLRGDRVPQPSAADYGVESVAVAASDDRVVYAAVGTGEGGRILVSRDRGEHWSDGGFRTYIEGNNEYRTGPERLSVDPRDARRAYFGSRTAGLFATTDGGRSWRQVSTDQIPASAPGDRVGVAFVLHDPSGSAVRGRSHRIWAGVAGHGVYLSTNGGRNWTLAYATTETPSDAKITLDGTLYVGFPHTIRRFTPADHAGTEVSAPSAGPGFLLGVDPHDASRLIATSQAVTPGNLFRSLDGGATWETLSYSLRSTEIGWPLQTTEGGYLSTGTFVVDPTHPGRVWFPQGIGVWRSEDVFDADTAVTWNFVSAGIEEAVTYDLVAPPGGAPISAIADRNGFRHDDPDAYPARTVLTDAFSAGTSVSYAAARPSYVAMVSSDTRAQYQPIDTPWTTAPASGYSTDGGRTWTPFGGDKSQIRQLYGGNIAVSANAESMVWQPSIPALASGDPQNVPQYSTDDGRSWTPSTGISAGTGIHDLIWWGSKRALDADTVTAGTFYLYTTRNHGEFFRSTDGGVSFVRMPGTPPTGDGNDSHVFGQVHAVPGRAGHVWSSNAQGGLSYTTDGGATWTRIAAVQDARAFGFGAPVQPGGYPAVFANARIGDVWGVYRSDDQGQRWSLVSRYPGGYAATITVVTGDPARPGRVYVGFGGNGVVYGDVARRR